MEPSFDIERRSAVPPTATTVSVVPEDAHDTVKKIVSLLSRALVLALGLLKSMVITTDAPRSRRIENSGVDNLMVLEEARMDPTSAHVTGPSFSVVEGRSDPISVNGNR